MEDYKTLQTISGIVTHIQATKDTSGKKAFIGKIRSKELAHEENCLIDLKTCWSAGIDHFLDDSATIMVEAAWNESIRQYIAKNIMPCFSSDQNNFLIHGIKKTADKTRILLVNHADHLRGIVFSCFYDSLDMIVNEFSPCPDMPIMVTVKVISRNNSIKLDPVAFFSPKRESFKVSCVPAEEVNKYHMDFLDMEGGKLTVTAFIHKPLEVEIIKGESTFVLPVRFKKDAPALEIDLMNDSRMITGRFLMHGQLPIKQDHVYLRTENFPLRIKIKRSELMRFGIANLNAGIVIELTIQQVTRKYGSKPYHVWEIASIQSDLRTMVKSGVFLRKSVVLYGDVSQTDETGKEQSVDQKIKKTKTLLDFDYYRSAFIAVAHGHGPMDIVVPISRSLIRIAQQRYPKNGQTINVSYRLLVFKDHVEAICLGIERLDKKEESCESSIAETILVRYIGPSPKKENLHRFEVIEGNDELSPGTPVLCNTTYHKDLTPMIEKFPLAIFEVTVKYFGSVCYLQKTIKIHLDQHANLSQNC
jgi:hypothetical protein